MSHFLVHLLQSNPISTSRQARQKKVNPAKAIPKIRSLNRCSVIKYNQLRAASCHWFIFALDFFAFLVYLVGAKKDRIRADKELFTQRWKLRDKSFDIKSVKKPARTLFFLVHFQMAQALRLPFTVDLSSSDGSATGFWLTASVSWWNHKWFILKNEFVLCVWGWFLKNAKIECEIYAKIHKSTQGCPSSCKVW